MQHHDKEQEVHDNEHISTKAVQAHKHHPSEQHTSVARGTEKKKPWRAPFAPQQVCHLAGRSANHVVKTQEPTHGPKTRAIPFQITKKTSEDTSPTSDSSDIMKNSGSRITPRGLRSTKLRRLKHCGDTNRLDRHVFMTPEGSQPLSSPSCSTFGRRWDQIQRTRTTRKRAQTTFIAAAVGFAIFCQKNLQSTSFSSFFAQQACSFWIFRGCQLSLLRCCHFHLNLCALQIFRP